MAGAAAAPAVITDCPTPPRHFLQRLRSLPSQVRGPVCRLAAQQGRSAGWRRLGGKQGLTVEQLRSRRCCHQCPEPASSPCLHCIPDAKWGERPLLIVAPKAGQVRLPHRQQAKRSACLPQPAAASQPTGLRTATPPRTRFATSRSRHHARVPAPGLQSPSRDDILCFLEGRIAKWWMPEDVVFVKEIPHTATGKISKLTLRQKYGNHRPRSRL